MTTDASMDPEENTTLSTTYVLNAEPSEDILLSLTIGDHGQMGRTTFNLFSNEITIDGSVKDYLLGTNDELDGQRLRIDTLVIDLSRSHNHATLLVTLKGGSKDVNFPLGKMAEEGGTTLFSLELLFLKV